MLEIARAFKQGPRPDRTLVFAAWTAEERGLLGSEYYAAHPWLPLETTVANLTMDVLQTAGLARDVVLVGAGQSELDPLLAKKAARQGRVVTPDAKPERGLAFRADHFPFAQTRRARVAADGHRRRRTTSSTAAARPATAGSPSSRRTVTTRPATAGATTGTCAAPRRTSRSSTRWRASWRIRATGRSGTPSSEFKAVRDASAARRSAMTRCAAPTPIGSP